MKSFAASTLRRSVFVTLANRGRRPRFLDIIDVNGGTIRPESGA